MPIVRGVGDEVLYAALAAAATPLAVAFCPKLCRRSPLALLTSGLGSLTKALRLLFARVKLWLLRKALSLMQHSRSGTPAVAKRLPRRGHVSLLDGELEKEGKGASYILSETRQGKAEGARVSETCAEAVSRVSEHQGTAMPPTDGPPEGEFCAICHDDFAAPCQANCGHWYCAECILRVWHHASALTACRCPICRRTITLLVPTTETKCPGPPPSDGATAKSDAETVTTSAADGAHTPPPQRAVHLRDIAKYNRLFGGVPVSLWQRVLDMPLLLRRMGRDFTNPSRAISLLHNMRMAVSIGLVVLYTLSPLDILPESVLGLLGYADDVVFLACVAFYLTVLYRATLLSRASAFPHDAPDEN